LDIVLYDLRIDKLCAMAVAVLPMVGSIFVYWLFTPWNNGLMINLILTLSLMLIITPMLYFFAPKDFEPLIF